MVRRVAEYVEIVTADPTGCQQRGLAPGVDLDDLQRLPQVVPAEDVDAPDQNKQVVEVSVRRRACEKVGSDR
jgi:hypothetical protein